MSNVHSEKGPLVEIDFGCHNIVRANGLIGFVLHNKCKIEMQELSLWFNSAACFSAFIAVLP